VSLGNEIVFTEIDVRVASLAQALLERGLDIRLLALFVAWPSARWDC